AREQALTRHVAVAAAVAVDSVPAPHAVPIPAPVAAPAAASGSGTAPAVQAAQPRGEKELDSLLAAGRKKPGLRYDAVRLRSYLDGIIGNPFVYVLVAGGTLSLTQAQSDTVVVHLTRFQTFKDSTWRAVAMALAVLPDDYDLDTAWSQMLRSADAVIQQMLTDGAAVKSVLSLEQADRLPVRTYLDPGCAAVLHQRIVNRQNLVPHADGTPPVAAEPGGCTVR
ncbi:MAG TPA: hypothetical protein VMH39_08200, partial [Gemmatimonadaceae bacterium]|nr:hypothetical protein [Gemmatimonadaceae bacterium]